MDVEKEIWLFRDKMALLKEKDKYFRVYNSKYHKYEFNPVLTVAEVWNFENKYEIKLPEDYRLFLMTIGNGGAGPDAGISSLGADRENNPNLPFRWRAEDSLEGSEFEEFYDHRPGVIEIVSYGYETDYLVVNGESYGTIWTEYPNMLFSTNRTFIENYNHWLDAKLKRLEKDREIDLKIEEIKEGMSKFEIANIIGQERKVFYEKKDWGGEGTWLIFERVPARFYMISDSVARIDRFDTLMDNPDALWLPQ